MGKTSWGWSIKYRNTKKAYFRNCLTKSRSVAKRDGHKPCLASLECIHKAYTGRCACCGAEEGTSRRLHMDHDHKTGKFRGFLCCRCNSMLGFARDDCAVLSCGIRYLSENS